MGLEIVKLSVRPFAVVIYVPAKLMLGWSGYCFGPVIFIDDRYRHVDGWLIHELTHTSQFYRTWGAHAIRYYIDKKYRISCETEAYYNQLLRAKKPGLTRHQVENRLNRIK